MSKIADFIVQENISKNAGRISQFGITPIDSADAMDCREMASLGIWGIKNPKPLAQAISSGAKFNVVVGFRPSRFHVGHITLAKELLFLAAKGGVPHFVVSGHAGGESLPVAQAEQKVQEFLKYCACLNSGTPITQSRVFSDTHSQEVFETEAKVSAVIKLNKVMQLYGWDTDISLQRLREVTSSVAAYLVMAYMAPKTPSVVLVDANQATHVDLANQAAKKLNVPGPSFTFRSLLPSLRNVEGRMTSKDPRSVIYLDESEDVISKKLLKSTSGGRPTPEEQRLQGGQAEKCNFIRTIDAMSLSEASDEVFNNCKAGRVLCGECKQSGTKLFLQQLKS